MTMRTHEAAAQRSGLEVRRWRETAVCYSVSIKEGLRTTDRMCESRWHTHHTTGLERDTAGGCQDRPRVSREDYHIMMKDDEDWWIDCWRFSLGEGGLRASVRNLTYQAWMPELRISSAKKCTDFSPKLYLCNWLLVYASSVIDFLFYLVQL